MDRRLVEVVSLDQQELEMVEAPDQRVVVSVGATRVHTAAPLTALNAAQEQGGWAKVTVCSSLCGGRIVAGAVLFRWNTVRNRAPRTAGQDL
jgi:hypothetical protein